MVCLCASREKGENGLHGKETEREERMRDFFFPFKKREREERGENEK